MSPVRTLLEQAATRLAGSGDTPRLDAELLLGHVLGRDRAWLYAWPEHLPSRDQQQAFEALLERRLQGQPVAYLVGQREFWSLRLAVSAATLIPRPETEHLVEQALGLPLPDDARVVDLGTGSGAIALTLAHERPRWQVSASDRSAAALEVARDNARRLGLDRVRFHHGDWCDALPHGARYHLVISNPPYVARQAPELRQGDVRFEPPQALLAGDDGLDAIRTLIGCVPAHLERGGWLWLEHGFDQAAAVRALLATRGFTGIVTRSDLAGHDRCTGGTWRGPGG